MDTNWLMLIVLAFLTGIAVYVGRLWFGRLVNPLSIYSATWGFCLCNYELRLIQYEYITRLAWIYIIVAWLFLYLGAATVLCLRPPVRALKQHTFVMDLGLLRRTIVFLGAVGAVGVLDQVRTLNKQFGSAFGAIVTGANDLYASRSSGEMTSIPYAGSFALIACALSGIYTARLGKMSALAVGAILLVMFQSIFGMGRLGLGMGAVLFTACFLYTPKLTRTTFPRWQQVAVVLTAIVFLAGGFVFVSSVRGLGVDFPGITPAMDRVTEYIPVFPSLYSDFSATPVAFSLYLSASHLRSDEFIGRYTFAPLFRLLSKFGFRTNVPPYEENYFTPVPMNTDTYLKNVYSDFGVSGIVLFPYILGMIAAGLLVSLEANASLIKVVLMANLTVVVIFAFLFNVMLLGDWYISAVGGTLSASFVQRRSRIHNATSIVAAHL